MNGSIDLDKIFSLDQEKMVKKFKQKNLLFAFLLLIAFVFVLFFSLYSGISIEKAISLSAILPILSFWFLFRAGKNPWLERYQVCRLEDGIYVLDDLPKSLFQEELTQKYLSLSFSKKRKVSRAEWEALQKINNK